MSVWSNETKNSSSSTNETKNTSRLVDYLRHGKEPTLQDLANYTLQDVVFPDGTTLGDVTVEELLDIVYTNLTKN